MTYRLRYTEEAKQALHLVPGNFRQRLRREIEALARTPRPPHAVLLRGATNRYRVRLDRWRLIYSVRDEEAVVRILRIRLKTGPETYHDLGQ